METLCMSPTPDYTDEELRELYSPANIDKLSKSDGGNAATTPRPAVTGGDYCIKTSSPVHAPIGSAHRTMIQE